MHSPPSLLTYLTALITSFVLCSYFLSNPRWRLTDCLLVNTSFGSLKCLQQNYSFFPIKATCLCTLSQFAMSAVPGRRRISAALCVNNLSAAVAETFQSMQNQAAHYSLLGLSVTSKDLPAVSKPLGSKLLGSGERQVCLEHARKFVDK